MSKHLNQVSHNKEFLCHQCEHFNDRYFDWKVICCFYIAFHAIKALAYQKGINIGSTHQSISSNLNPACPNPQMAISRWCWKNYRDLRISSESARYNGFSTLQDHEDQNRENLLDAFEQMNEVLKYCNKRGVDVTPLEPKVSIDLISL